MKNNIKNKVWNLVKLSVFTFPLSVFVSCSQEEDFSQSDATDVVKVVASVSNMQTRVTYGDNGATNFTNEDAIKVVNTLRTSKHEATYTTTDGTNWTTSDAFVWNGGAGKNNQFNAWYPIADYSSYDGFTIPTDQSDVTKLASADWMTASTEAMAKPADQVLNLNFQHRLTKVTVKIANWGTEYEGWKPITDVNIYSKTSQYPDVTDDLVAVTPLQNGETEFTAIVAPMAYKSTDQLMVFTVDYTDNLTVFANNSTLTSGLEPGKHYTFSLKVGKDAVGIENVVVTDWTEKEIDGGVAEEVIPNTFDATAMTPEQLNAAVTEALDYGHTELAITLAADAGDVEEYEASEMLVALRTALAESTVPDGSINLTISGIKNIPYEGFIDMIDYWENNDKNIGGDKLKSLTLTDVETIGEYAFSACTYLESVNLPQVVTIGECAFNEWKKGTKLTSLNLPNATTIGDWAFAYSSLLTSINLPKVTSIGVLAFGYCDLRTLDLPEATTIDGEAFYNNEKLVSCSAPKATTIGYYPWGKCSKLEALELTAAGNFTIGNNIFEHDTPTEQIDLVLNQDKESQVTKNDNGTAIWKCTVSNGGYNSNTFKSITFKE